MLSQDHIFSNDNPKTISLHIFTFNSMVQFLHPHPPIIQSERLAYVRSCIYFFELDVSDKIDKGEYSCKT